MSDKGEFVTKKQEHRIRDLAAELWTIAVSELCVYDATAVPPMSSRFIPNIEKFVNANSSRQDRIEAKLDGLIAALSMIDYFKPQELFHPEKESATP